MVAAVPRLTTSCTVPPNMNKLPVVGQTPFGAPGADPHETPTPLQGKVQPGPLQVYETDRPFFGSTPVGGLEIMTSESVVMVCHHHRSSKPSLSLLSPSSAAAPAVGVVMTRPWTCIPSFMNDHCLDHLCTLAAVHKQEQPV